MQDYQIIFEDFFWKMFDAWEKMQGIYGRPKEEIIHTLSQIEKAMREDLEWWAKYVTDENYNPMDGKWMTELFGKGWREEVGPNWMEEEYL